MRRTSCARLFNERLSTTQLIKIFGENMKKLTIFFILFLFVNFCFATTVYLRKGGTVKGEVISKDDEKFVLKTEDGEEKTIKWRRVKNKTIKEIYPELYESLKEKALAKKKGESAKKENDKLDFSRINLKVETNESAGSYKKHNIKNKIYKISKKECIGKINVKIGNLDSDKKYTLKIVYSHYLQIKKTLDIDIKKTPDDKNIVNEEILSGKNNYEIEIKTSPYYYYKVKPRAGYRVKKKGGSKMEFGDRGAGWDISIWLDNTLIYEEKKGKNPVFYHNISH